MALAIAILVIFGLVIASLGVWQLTARDDRQSLDDYRQGIRTLAKLTHEPTANGDDALVPETPHTGNVRVLPADAVISSTSVTRQRSPKRKPAARSRRRGSARTRQSSQRRARQRGPETTTVEARMLVTTTPMHGERVDPPADVEPFPSPKRPATHRPLRPSHGPLRPLHAPHRSVGPVRRHKPPRRRSHPRNLKASRIAATAGIACILAAGIASAVTRGPSHHSGQAGAASKLSTVVRQPSESSPPSSTLPAVQHLTAVAGPNGDFTALVAQPVVAVTIDATARCWAEIHNAGRNGPIVYSGVIQPGTPQQISLNGGGWLRLGAPGSVTVNVDGQQLAGLPANGPVNVSFVNQGSTPSA